MTPNTQDDLSAGYLAQRNVTDEDIDARQLAAATRTDLAQADVAITAERMTQLQPAAVSPEPAGAVAPPDTGAPNSGSPAQPTGGFAPGAGGGAGLPAIKAAGEFVANLPRNVAIGGLKASMNIESFIYDSVATVASSFTEKPVSGRIMKGFVDELFSDIAPEFDENIRDVLKQAETDGPADLMTQSMAEFLLPFSAYAKLNASMGLTGTLGKKALNVITADAQTNITALDPHMERFAGLLQEFEVAGDVPILGTFIDYLADTSTESAAEGRFKNALDSASVNATFVGALFGAGKLIKFAWDLPGAVARMPSSPPAGSKAAQRGAVGDLSARTGIETALKARGASGDNLLNQMDKFDELAAVNAQISNDGAVTLFHRTSKENATKIRATGKMFGKEEGLFFSTEEAGQAVGFGDTVVKLKVPIEKVEIDDIFPGSEASLRFPTGKINSPINIKAFLEK